MDVKTVKFGDGSKEQNHCHSNTGNNKGHRDYVWLTPDFLENFRPRDVPPISSKSPSNYRNRLPPVYSERLRALEEKASTKRKQKGKISQSIAKEFRINLRGTRYFNDGIQFKPCSSTMDTGEPEEKKEPHLDDIIDSVAKANSVHLETGSVLPEIRAAQCPIHVKRERGKGQSLLYSSNSHAKSPHKVKPHSIYFPQSGDPSHGLNLSPRRFDMNVRIPEQFPIKPPLPKRLPSKEFVMTWLMHGSDPLGSNHFPDIIHWRHSDKRSKSNLTPRKRDPSE